MEEADHSDERGERRRTRRSVSAEEVDSSDAEKDEKRGRRGEVGRDQSLEDMRVGRRYRRCMQGASDCRDEASDEERHRWGSRYSEESEQSCEETEFASRGESDQEVERLGGEMRRRRREGQTIGRRRMGHSHARAGQRRERLREDGKKEVGEEEIDRDGSALGGRAASFQQWREKIERAWEEAWEEGREHGREEMELELSRTRRRETHISGTVRGPAERPHEKDVTNSRPAERRRDILARWFTS